MPRRPDTNTFGFLVADVARLMRAEMDRAISQAGIGVTAGEVRTLFHAARAGRARQLVLAENMGVEAMTLSAYLDALEAKGLVTRVVDPADRRAKLVEVTDAADAVLDAVSDISSATMKIGSESISADDWSRSLSVLRTVRTNLCRSREEWSKKDPPA